jgi:tetratricopeptide (TPR) repeat protein
MSAGRLPLLIGLGLVVLTLAAYGPVWDNGFIDMDDEEYITDNAQVLGGLTGKDIAWAWATYDGSIWMPLTWMSFQFDATVASALSGSRIKLTTLAVVCHWQNLLWHCATVLLLFVVLRRLTGALSPSALTAALFAVHPLHVESVAWASERKDTLSTFFWVLTMLAYCRHVERPSLGRYLLVVAAFVAGLLAKPMLVTLPCVLLLLDWWPLRRWGWREGEAPAEPKGDGSAGASPSQCLLEKVPLFLIAGAACFVAVQAQQSTGAVLRIEDLSWADRLANAVLSYGWYLGKTFWPTELAAFYPHPEANWQWAPVLISAAVLLAVTIAALVWARRWPWLLVGWLWFLGTLVPVIGLVQIGLQARADRYVYVPHIGLFIALVWSAAALARRVRLPAAVQAGAAGMVLLLLMVVARAQVGYWRDTESLWTHALQAVPNNHRAHFGLGRPIFQLAKQTGDRDLLEKARPHFEQAVALWPNQVEYRSCLGMILLNQGKLAEAVRHLQAGVRRDPEAIWVWHNLGLAQRRQRHFQEAVESLSRVLELAPMSVRTPAQRSLIVEAHTELGLALWQLRRREEAEEQWQAALRLDPGAPAHILAQAWQLATVPDSAERDAQTALALAEQVCRAVKEPSWEALDARAAALAALGRYPEAVQTAQQALQHAPPEQAQGIRERLALYEAGKPFVAAGD